MWDAPVYAWHSSVRPAQVWPDTSESKEWTGPAIFSRLLRRTLPGLAGRSDICALVHSALFSPEKPGLHRSLGACSATALIRLASIDTSVIAKARQLEQRPRLTQAACSGRTEDIKDTHCHHQPVSANRRILDMLRTNRPVSKQHRQRRYEKLGSTCIRTTVSLPYQPFASTTKPNPFHR